MEISEKLHRHFSAKKKKLRAAAGEETGTQCLAYSYHKFFSKKIEFHTVSSSDCHLEHLKLKYKPLNNIMANPKAPPGCDEAGGRDKNVCENSASGDKIPNPKKELFDSRDLEIEWKNPRGIGAGLYNMGNTCFLNSVLQCLVYTPPLYNFVTTFKHKSTCPSQGFCVMCELQKHTAKVFNSPNGLVKPSPIVQNLRVISKQFRQGRQEDAHEFLRYFVDGLQKACLLGQPPKLDLHSKATTVVHKIFGGYHRSQVKCLECMKTSDTFDPLLDISLDIKNCNTLTRALQKSIQVDTLENDNSYACPYCKKMTRAQKKFTVHRLPNVLTVQLKRFEFNGLFGGKINKSIAYQEHVNMRPYMSDTNGPSEWYRLYAVLVHMGYSSNSGHYFCYVKNSNKTWYCMNDTSVTQEAYLLFYVKDSKYRPSESQGNQGLAGTSSSQFNKAFNNTKKNSQLHAQKITAASGSASGHPPPRAPLSVNKERGNGKTKAEIPVATKISGISTAKDSQQNPLPITAPKPPLSKPTGVVNPSPHPKPSKLGIISLPPSTALSSPPHPRAATPTTPTAISVPPPPPELATSKPDTTSPVTSMAASDPNATPTHVDPTASSANNVSTTSPPERNGTREFSIPLRKTAIVTPPNSVKANTSAVTSKLPTTIPVPDKQEVKITIAKPIFTPRQVGNPARFKKVSKYKKPSLLGTGKVVQGSSSASAPTLTLAPQLDNVPVETPVRNVKSVSTPTPAQALVSPSKPSQTLLEIAEGAMDNTGRHEEMSVTPTAMGGSGKKDDMKTLSESAGETKQCTVTTAEAPLVVTVGSAHPPQYGNIIKLMASKEDGANNMSNLPITPMTMQTTSAKQQKVAMVSPLPHHQSGQKPVARVKPSLHLSPVDSGSRGGMEAGHTSSGFKVSGSLTPSPHMPAQASKSSPWVVTSKSHDGKSREGGARRSVSDGTPAGWKVTEAPKPVTSECEDVFSSSKPPKKKRKKHHYRSCSSSSSDYSNSDTDWRPHDHKHHRSSNSKRRQDREHTRKRNRRDYSDMEEDYHHSRSLHEHDSRHHSKKHKKTHKKHRDEREREKRREKERRKHRRHSTTSYIYSSASESGEDEKKKHHRDRDSHKYSSKRRDQYSASHDQHHSSSRHHKHRSSTPESEEERLKKKDRRHERSNRSRSPVTDSKWLKFGTSDQREAKESTKKHKNERDGRPSKEVEVKSVTDTIKHLTSHSWDKLGENVLSWSGGGNSIDCSSAAMDEGLRKPVRDKWDQDLDKGKVKKVRKHYPDDFQSGKNAFQEYQTNKNVQ